MRTVDLFEQDMAGGDTMTLMRDFLVLAKKELGLQALPKIEWVKDPKVSDTNHSFGRYTNDDKVIRVVLKNRHPLDVMRTLAHELTHYKQDLEDRLTARSGDTGSPIENDANATAGRIMRIFSNRYPKAFWLPSIGTGD